MTKKTRSMIGAFQYLTPPEWGGPARRVYVRVRKRKRRDRDADYDFDDSDGVRVAAGLAALGAVRAYIRYDGGHDEGFGYFDHCTFRGWERRYTKELIRDLKAADPVEFRKADEMLAEAAQTWARDLLGEFGTGEYKMFGAFWVNLKTGQLIDDRDAAPKRW